jgi:hypothetical protein
MAAAPKAKKTFKREGTPIILHMHGISPLLQSNPRTADPRCRYAIAAKDAHRAMKAKGADPDEMIEALYRIKWEGRLYHTATEAKPGARYETLGPYLPVQNVVAALSEAGKLTREGSDVLRGVAWDWDTGTKVAIEYDGPRDIEGMWNYPDHDNGFIDIRPVGVNNALIMGVRPRFPPGWKIHCPLIVNTSMIAMERVKELAMVAGAFTGIGDGRIGLLAMGRFNVEVEVLS